MEIEYFFILILFFAFGIFLGYELKGSTAPVVKSEEKTKQEYKIHRDKCKCSRYEYKQVNSVDGSNSRYVCKDCGRTETTKQYFLHKNPSDYLIE